MSSSEVHPSPKVLLVVTTGGFTHADLSPKYTYLYAKAKQILIQSNEKSGHESGYYMRNVLRMKRIAHVAANRRNLAADLVEELMYDNELRVGHGGQELRPMHLQTADMRMPAYKAKNWDLYAVCFLGVSGLVGSTWFAGRWLWMFRAGLVERIKGLGLFLSRGSLE